jgi:hypothetical protein
METGEHVIAAAGEVHLVRRCRLPVSTPALKAPTVAALETVIS